MRNLTKSEREELISDLRREDIKKYADRIRTILLLDQGWSIERIAEALFISLSSIHRYRKSYEQGGIEQLIQDGYFGKRTSLSSDELSILEAALNKQRFLSSKEVVAFIIEEFKVEYSVSGVTKLLHRLDYSYRKPDPKPEKCCLKKQKSFLKSLKLIRSKMMKKDKIYFVDACHPQLNSMPQYGWFKRGSKKYLPISANKNRANILGAVDIDHQDTLFRTFKTINSQSVLTFIKRIESKHPEARKITLVTDNAAYFRSFKVIQKLKNSKIRIKYLPPYSPNLNPIERLWKYLQKNILYNIFHENPKQFKKELTNFIRTLRVTPHTLARNITLQS